MLWQGAHELLAHGIEAGQCHAGTHLWKPKGTWTVDKNTRTCVFVQGTVVPFDIHARALTDQLLVTPSNQPVYPLRCTALSFAALYRPSACASSPPVRCHPHSVPGGSSLAHVWGQ